MTQNLKLLPAHERPRERLVAQGAAALQDAELLAILLGTGVRGTNAVELGRALLQKFGGLSGLARCTVAELAGQRGIGPAKAVQLAAAFGLGARFARGEAESARLDSPAAIYGLLQAEMRLLSRECLRVVLLNAQLRLQRVVEVSSGTVNETVAHPRDVLQPVIQQGAYAFALVHNHPSGQADPSEADRRFTVRLAEAASLLQVKLVDHVIIGAPSPGRSGYFSFREAGLL
ncbi:MAG: DNA repair protein RadC [Verrucomicrobia bacterium]|nr:DNA repair protein RadC [Verrucomicrobiota bacterium]